MSLIRWGESFSLNIPEIDNQHRQLVAFANELYDAMISAQGNEVIETVLKKLVEYTDYHFSTEERYFDQFSYPESEQHKKEHKYFVQEVTAFTKAIEDGRTRRVDSNRSITVDLWNFLKEWLINHIKVSDAKYAELFKSKGL
jgi:hemerythrin